MDGMFEVNHFLTQKWLLSMSQGEVRELPVGRCKYDSLKSTASQLKKKGLGEWKCSKKYTENSGLTRVTRVS